MKKNLLSVFSVVLVIALTAAFSFGQEDRRTINAASSLYVISAEAGVVNYTEGKVAVALKNGRSGYLLKGDELETGDKVSTGTNGRAEILLNPGSFVRLGENSKFEFLTTSLDNLQLKLTGGSAMFEVITDDEFTFAVNTPKMTFYIIKSGVYRIDVLPDGISRIEVWKGEAQVGDTDATRVKSGRQATISNDQTAVVKFDRDEKDALETWSKTRAKELAKINSRLDRSRADRRFLRGSLINSFYRNSWNLYGSYGVWVYNPFYGTYCFLPFGYGWNSPYGYNYPFDIWRYNLPPVIYNQPPPQQPQQPNNQPTTPSNTPTEIVPGVRNTTGNSRAPRKTDSPRKFEPPYKRVQRDIGSSPVRRVDVSPFPTRVPSSPMPTVITPRVPTKRP